MATIETILEKARKQREAGHAVASLNTFNEALMLAQKQGNRERLLQVFVDRAIAWRHLYEDQGDVAFAILARKDAETILEIVKTFGVGERLHTAYYMLGQAALLFKDYADAENYFFKSLRYFKGTPAEKGSWRYHWAKALYMIGEKKKSLLAFAQAIEEIKKNERKTDKFLYNVYLSGAYANFAFVLRKENPQESKKYLELAKEIINADKRLVVRKKQLKDLERLFK